jgi:hypothetical protein
MNATQNQAQAQSRIDVYLRELSKHKERSYDWVAQRLYLIEEMEKLNELWSKVDTDDLESIDSETMLKMRIVFTYASDAALIAARAR